MGDIFLRNNRYKGLAPIGMTLAFRNITMHKDDAPAYVRITFGSEGLKQQLQRLESVLEFLRKEAKIPRNIRMELGKKVVVKIAQ